MVTYYSFFILTILYNFYLILKSNKMLKEISEEIEIDLNNEYYYLKFYPILLSITFIPVIIYRILVYWIEQRIYWFAFIQITLDSLRSILIILCFAYTNNIKKAIKNVLSIDSGSESTIEDNCEMEKYHRSLLMKNNSGQKSKKEIRLSNETFISNIDDSF